MSKYIVDRALPERSKLIFYFPVPTEGNEYYVVNMPFYENISVKESKRARYQKYSLISRSSNLYSYAGADSRQLSLSFNITLPHLLDLHPDINFDRFINYSSDRTQGSKQKFLEPMKIQSTPKSMAFRLGTNYTRSLAKDSAKQVLLDSSISKSLTASEREYLSLKYGLDRPSDIQDQALNQQLYKAFGKKSASEVVKLVNVKNSIEKTKQGFASTQEVKFRIIDIIIYWINVIRSSVNNYSKNPIFGPPVIRLNHGIMYQDIPCICTDYSIDFNESAGYDMDTLLPRQLKIELKLEEFRAGDFGEFSGKIDSNVVKRDNLAGWEAVILGETHSMDPGYSNIL